MSDTNSKIPLPELEPGSQTPNIEDAGSIAPSDDEHINRGVEDLEAFSMCR
jgi:hypothetical protein